MGRKESGERRRRGEAIGNRSDGVGVFREETKKTSFFGKKEGGEDELTVRISQGIVFGVSLGGSEVDSGMRRGPTDHIKKIAIDGSGDSYFLAGVGRALRMRPVNRGIAEDVGGGEVRVRKGLGKDGES